MRHSESTAVPAHLGWRLLAMVYDLLPVIAIWFAVSALTLLLRGGEPAAPGSLAGWLELLGLWVATGGYAVLSWRHGGQTLGQRAWRLRVCDRDGGVATGSRLWLRYTVAPVSALVLGLGYLWALFDPRARTWHDLAAGTELVREPRPTGRRGRGS